VALDHKAVKIDINLSKNNQGPGSWKFNNSLLNVEEYVKLMQNNYNQICVKYCAEDDKILKWGLIKMETRSDTIPYSKNKAKKIKDLLCNISTTSASVSSGVPNTNKQMKARGHRPSAFIVSRCLEPLMKPEARVFYMASQSRVINNTIIGTINNR